MTHLSPTQAEEHLQHVAEQLAQWRQSRPTVRGSRIPAAVWTEALALAEVLSVPRVAQQLHLKPQGGVISILSAPPRRQAGLPSAAVVTCV